MNRTARAVLEIAVLVMIGALVGLLAGVWSA